MREIVTIQAGSFANYIGSHFWNFQDELHGLADSAESNEVFKNHSLNSDVLFRSGETQQGLLTYTPRLVSVDFQGSLGTMSLRGTLYHENLSQSSDVLTWEGEVTTQASDPLKKNLFLQSLYMEEKNTKKANNHDGNESSSHSEFQDNDIVECLENGVQYWTDFSKVHYHPQSLYELSGLWMDAQDFDNYGIGRDMFCTHQRGEEINERLRFFIEECDHIQGIQFIVDDSGGFSGVAAEFLESIADDYSNIPVLLYTVRSPGSYINMKSHKLNISRRLHDAVSFARLSSLCKLIVPVGLPSLSRSRASTLLSIKDEQPYYTSAVYASALHSLSLPFRIQHPGPTSDSVYACGELDMYEVIHMLADQSRQNMVSTLDVSMPAPSLTGDPSQWSLFENFIPLTPEVAKDIEDRHVIECMTVHGVLGSGNRRVPVSEVKNAVQGSYESTTLSTRPKFLHLSATRCPLPIPLPFPTLFGDAVGPNGEILETPLRDTCGPRGSLDVHSVPVAARLRSTTAILPFLERRLENLRKLGIWQGGIGVPVLESWGFGREEVEDLGEKLSHMVSTLNPYSDHSSDSD